MQCTAFFFLLPWYMTYHLGNIIIINMLWSLWEQHTWIIMVVMKCADNNNVTSECIDAILNVYLLGIWYRYCSKVIHASLWNWLSEKNPRYCCWLYLCTTLTQFRLICVGWYISEKPLNWPSFNLTNIKLLFIPFEWKFIWLVWNFVIINTGNLL